MTHLKRLVMGLLGLISLALICLVFAGLTVGAIWLCATYPWIMVPIIVLGLAYIAGTDMERS
jgi:uncharacterized membrane protein